MLTTDGQAILERTDDETFCDAVVSLCQQVRGDGLAFLYQAWVLTRLRLVKERCPTAYYGHLLSPLRRAFPGQVHSMDLEAALRSVGHETRAESGDYPPNEFQAAIEEVCDHGLPKGHSAGWIPLDDHYTVARGEMTIVTGIASHMKSSVVLAMAVNMAKQYGWNFGLFNPEHHPLGSLGGWLVEYKTQRSTTELYGEERKDAISWVVDHFHPITVVEETQPTLDWILAVAREQHTKYGLDGLVIDPWNEVEHCVGKEETETRYISRCLSKVRRFSRVHNIHTWIVAHPTKLQKATVGEYQGKYAPPTPYDIAGGAHWYNKADACLSIWRDAFEDSPIVEVHVHKMRHRHLGKPGKVNLEYKNRRFTSVGDMTQPHWSDKE